ncbi:MAG: hypothetical protein ABIA67_03750 [Candidatus Margulisiibacteriota bacterium]
MKRLIVLGICLGILLFPGYARADELSDLTSDLNAQGVPSEVVNDVLSGRAGTLGERLQAMVDNGAITIKQYKAIYRGLVALPQSQIQKIKTAYDRKGGAGVTGAIQQWKGDDASLRDHVKDLKQQGFTKEQIAARLRNEGIAAERLKALGYDLPKKEAVREKVKEKERIPERVKEKIVEEPRRGAVVEKAREKERPVPMERIREKAPRERVR